MQEVQTIDAEAVTAQTAALGDVSDAGAGFVAALDSALNGENDTHGANEEAQQETCDEGSVDFGYSKSIFTKKLPDPAKTKRRKKIAAASRRRNRRA